MGTFLFIAFVTAMVLAAVLFWRKRTREIAIETEAREHARAIAMGLVPGMVPPVVAAPEPVRPLVKVASPVPAAAPAFAAAGPVSIPDADAALAASPAAPVVPPPPPKPVPPPDARLLRTIKRNRFARVGLAWFEATGFRVKQQAGDSPIDALLFAGTSNVPVMSVRWSRIEMGLAPVAEVKAFAEATIGLKLARGTFISQHGVEPDAEQFARERGLVVIDATQLAAKFDMLDAPHHEVLTAIALGERK